jgi:von Willebrand factor type A domain
MIAFTHPIWLLLALPLAISIVVWRPPIRALRIALFAAIVLAMAGLALQLPSRAGTVVVVADRSLSMPRDADALERELANTIASKRPSGSNLAVVSFGSDAQVELPPGAARLGSFVMPPGQPESSLQRGLDAALSLIPPGAPGRIVLLTDGRWSGQDPTQAMLFAADRGIPVDYRMIERGSASDLAIERVDAPSSVTPGEAFVIRASIRSPAGGDARITLRRGNAIVAQGTEHLVAGENRIVLRDRAGGGGLLAYTLEAQSAAPDPLPENNRARFLVGVSGPKPVLVVSGNPSSRFAALLGASGVAVDANPQPAWTLETLANHSAVVLDNVSANAIGNAGMQTLRSWVTSAGGGLMLTGGRASYAAGGYFRSPLDPLLPVSMELRREHRKLRMSIVVTMDRSGSMAMAAGGGRTKMDLADLSAVQVLDLLSPNDELGVIAVDSAAHVVADLDPIEGREQELRRRIMSVESMGGGIFIYEALAASANMLITAHAETKHILLFADASDSEEPGDYKELLARCAKANITVSVVGLGTPQDSDAELLRDIARRGGGQAYFTDDPAELPRLFAQDTFIVARSAMVDVPTPLQATAALTSMTGRGFGALPPAGGFNLTYLRDGASPAVLTADEYHAPFVATWQAGLGRVLTYAGETDGALTGALGRWPEIGSFDASLVRWTAGGEAPLPGDMLVTQRVENGAARIDLQLDPERTTPGVTQPPEVATLAGLPGRAPAITKAKMRWTSPDTLTLEVPLRGEQTYLSSVQIPGAGRVTLPPVTLPYSPEYAPSLDGRATLERISRVTGGQERLAMEDVWAGLARRRQPVALTPWLLALAVLLLLVEVIERRMRIVTTYVAAAPAPAPAEPVVVERAAPEPQPEASDLLDALDRAKRRS